MSATTIPDIGGRPDLWLNRFATRVKASGSFLLATAATLTFSNLLARDFAGSHEVLKAALRKLVVN
jgi:hypothetical protein